MKIKLAFALFCAAFPFLAQQGHAQPPQPPAATFPNPEYVLGYVWLPDASHSGRSHWQWTLNRVPANASRHGQKQTAHTEVSANSLYAPSLKTYISRLPAGKSIELMWQFKKSDLTRQAGLANLQQLCANRKIGLHIFCFANPTTS